MKLLCFQARQFWWKSFSKTLAEVEAVEEEKEVRDAVVVFLHAEARDEPAEARERAFKHTLKHVKWLANKRELKNVVLHSFTHLGGENAAPEFAAAFLRQLKERLESTGYTVSITPFGYFCERTLSVHGESLAKVWKEI
jgi:transcriptional regulator with AAA-type ATPase domain